MATTSVNPALLALVASGDREALVEALAQTACLWSVLAGWDFRRLPYPGAAQCAVLASPSGGLLAAGHDLAELLRLFPEGRKALADLGCKPFFEQTESPRG